MNFLRKSDALPPESARPPAGPRPELHPQRLSLNSLIVQLTPTIERVLGQDVALEIECEQDLPPILGALSMVKLALVDLCATARTCMPENARLHLKTSLTLIESAHARRWLETRAGHFVCLQVQHAGPPAPASRSGFPGATDPKAQSNLATVYGIAQQHCGWLEVNWEEDGDLTSYDLYFPVAARSESTASVERALEIPGGSETILLVDDELDLLSLMRDILQRYGYRIITAPNGVEALKVWSKRHDEIDLLLTDMRMPEGINGYELAERLVGEKPGLKVIYVSGYSLETTAASNLREGANFLTKPYTPPGLAQAVRRMLDCAGTAKAA